MITQQEAVRLFAGIAGTQGGRVLIPAGDDDCGVISLDRRTALVITTDYTNFRPHASSLSGNTLQHRGALLVKHNVSDLLATGVAPLAFVAALGIPREFSVRHIRLLAEGLRDGGRESGVAILGGDTKEAPALSLCGTAVGIGTPARLWKRTGAIPGDALFLSGGIGGVSAALVALRQTSPQTGMHASARRAILTPRLPVTLAARLRRRPHRIAATDLSDGLGADLHRLLTGSGCAARVEASRVPLHPLARRLARHLGVDPLEFAFGVGGDLQFIFTAPARHTAALETAGAVRIGTVVRGSHSYVDIRGQQVPLPRFGHEDFLTSDAASRLIALMGHRFPVKGSVARATGGRRRSLAPDSR